MTEMSGDWREANEYYGICPLCNQEHQSEEEIKTRGGWLFCKDCHKELEDLFENDLRGQLDEAQAEVERLQDRDAKLSLLERGGVENWEWYDAALGHE